MDKVATSLKNHKSLTQSTAATIASMGLAKAGQKVAGTIVTPAVWVINYGSSGAVRDKADMGLYAAGFVAAIPATIVGLLKSAVDDRVNRLLSEVVSKEDARYRPYIKACQQYASTPSPINAQIIASKGGTAWRHPNGLWVYITDARGFMINDFEPKMWVEIYQPKKPLKKRANGSILWGVRR